MIMSYSVHDNFGIEGLHHFMAFRDNRYNFLYICKNCTRSFDSNESTDKCRFCGHQVTEIRSIKRGRGNWKQGFNKKVLYRYFCPTCEKNFTTTEKLAICSECRTDYLHVYTWDMLRKRDKLQIKLNRAIKGIFRKKEVGNPNSRTGMSQRFPRINSRNKEEMPSY